MEKHYNATTFNALKTKKKEVRPWNTPSQVLAKKYGPRPFQKINGYYQCPFSGCNKEIEANLDRHITHHEKNADEVDFTKINPIPIRYDNQMVCFGRKHFERCGNGPLFIENFYGPTSTNFCKGCTVGKRHASYRNILEKNNSKLSTTDNSSDEDSKQYDDKKPLKKRKAIKIENEEYNDKNYLKTIKPKSEKIIPPFVSQDIKLTKKMKLNDDRVIVSNEKQPPFKQDYIEGTEIPPLNLQTDIGEKTSYSCIFDIEKEDIEFFDELIETIFNDQGESIPFN